MFVADSHTAAVAMVPVLQPRQVASDCTGYSPIQSLAICHDCSTGTIDAAVAAGTAAAVATHAPAAVAAGYSPI